MSLTDDWCGWRGTTPKISTRRKPAWNKGFAKTAGCSVAQVCGTVCVTVGETFTSKPSIAERSHHCLLWVKLKQQKH